MRGSWQQGFGFGLISLLLLSATSVWADGAGGTIWKSDFAAAEAEARKLNVPLLVHFYGTWCPPCKQMEKETLYTSDLVRAVDKRYVAVKVNIKLAPDLQKRFGIKLLPSDVVVSPEGRVIAEHEGYASRNEYLGFLSRSEQKFLASRSKTPATIAQAAPTSKRETAATTKLPPEPLDLPRQGVVATPASQATTSTGRKSDGPQEKSAVPAVAQLKEEDDTLTEPVEGHPLVADQTNSEDVALEGYCPVTLRKTRGWQQGKKEFAYHYHDQLYLFIGEAELNAFKADPDRYTPGLLGCDPVTMTDTKVAVQGTTKFGEYFDGRLFLFENAENRTRFKQNPSKYTQIRHALNPDEIKKRQL